MIEADAKAVDAAARDAVLKAVDGLWRTDAYLTPEEAMTVARAAVDAVRIADMRAAESGSRRQWWWKR